MKAIHIFLIISVLVIGLCQCKADSSDPQDPPVLHTCADVNWFIVKQDGCSFACYSQNEFRRDCLIPYSMDLTKMWVTFELCDGAKAYIGDVEQYSSIQMDYTLAPFEYRVVSEDGLTVNNYTVNVLQQGIEAKVISFSLKINGTMYSGTVDSVAHTITVDVPSAVTITEACYYYELSPGASYSPYHLSAGKGITFNSGEYCYSSPDNDYFSIWPEVATIGDCEGDEPTEYTIHLNRT